jgi:twitching motility two-component system response regulator PilH
MVSTKSQATDRMWGMRQGASEYLTKPVTEEILLAAVNKMLSK